MYSGQKVHAERIRLPLREIPGPGRSPGGGGNGNPLQDSRLGNPVDKGTWWAAVHEVTDTTEHHHHKAQGINIESAFYNNLVRCWGSAGKESAHNPGDLGSIPGWEDPLEKRKATHCSILVRNIPWTVYFMGSQRVGHDWATFTSLNGVLSIKISNHFMVHPKLI